MPITPTAAADTVWADGFGRLYANVSATHDMAADRLAAQALIAAELSERLGTYISASSVQVELAPEPDWPSGPGLHIEVPPNSVTYRERG